MRRSSSISAARSSVLGSLDRRCRVQSHDARSRPRPLSATPLTTHALSSSATRSASATRSCPTSSKPHRGPVTSTSPSSALSQLRATRRPERHALGPRYPRSLPGASSPTMRSEQYFQQLLRTPAPAPDSSAHLARTHLLTASGCAARTDGIDARGPLRTAHEMFSTMGAEAFAERAARELLATGEKARKRTADTRDRLTAQETQIAELARKAATRTPRSARSCSSARGPSSTTCTRCSRKLEDQLAARPPGSPSAS